MLRDLGGYMAERDRPSRRAHRAICELRGSAPSRAFPRLRGAVILVARDLGSAETATLNPETVLSIITEVRPHVAHCDLAKRAGHSAIVKAGIMNVEGGHDAGPRRRRRRGHCSTENEVSCLLSVRCAVRRRWPA